MSPGRLLATYLHLPAKIREDQGETIGDRWSQPDAGATGRERPDAGRQGWRRGGVGLGGVRRGLAHGTFVEGAVPVRERGMEELIAVVPRARAERE